MKPEPQRARERNNDDGSVAREKDPEPLGGALSGECGQMVAPRTWGIGGGREGVLRAARRPR